MKADQTGGEHQDKKRDYFFLEKLEKQVGMKLKVKSFTNQFISAGKRQARCRNWFKVCI